MARFTRRAAMLATAVFALAACGSAGSQTASGPAAIALTDLSKGEANAPITIVEYASWTCGHCKSFHDEVMPTINDEFIKTGKVKFVFREFPTPPADISAAGFALARCAGEGNYFAMLDDLFDKQADMMTQARAGTIKQALIDVATRHGVKGEEAFTACLDNADVLKAIQDNVTLGQAEGVNSTPTIFINGVRNDTYESRTAEGMRNILNAELEKAGQ